MADDDRPGRQPGHERLQPLQPVEVEVVGRLVEQEDVEPAEQQGGEPGPGGLAAGEPGHRRCQVDREPQVGGGRVGPLGEVGAAERQPAFQRVGVGVGRARLVVGQRPGRRVHPAGRRGDAGPPGEEVQHDLARAPLRLLREVADGRVRRRQPDAAGRRRVGAGEDPQQTGLAGPVRPDQPDPLRRPDDQVKIVEQVPATASSRDTLGDKRRAHLTDHLPDISQPAPGRTPRSEDGEWRPQTDRGTDDGLIDDEPRRLRSGGPTEPAR